MSLRERLTVALDLLTANAARAVEHRLAGRIAASWAAMDAAQEALLDLDGLVHPPTCEVDTDDAPGDNEAGLPRER